MNTEAAIVAFFLSIATPLIGLIIAIAIKKCNDSQLDSINEAQKRLIKTQDEYIKALEEYIKWLKIKCNLCFDNNEDDLK